MKINLQDQRLTDVLEILNVAPLEGIQNCLDIGMGDGSVSIWFSKKGITTIGTTLDREFRIKNYRKFKEKYGIKIIRTIAEKLPYSNNSFDCIVLSHVLEHCLNVGSVLKEINRILSDRGWLFLFVPPFDNRVCAGHVTTGWNIGQLMYVLSLSGFDIKSGHFIEYGYNVCAFVQISQRKLPRLNNDRGDIALLSKKGILPVFNNEDGYWGDIKAWNWPNDQILLKTKRSTSYRIFTKVLIKLVSIIPINMKSILGSIFVLLGNMIKVGHSFRMINPKKLSY
ncbi:MAG: class I SAM-dependent methyltransferase [Patescibacteria group bacterium]|nr:class I SAM-dependent methyltransferase [Patescibacteria group bacterium]